MPNVRKVDWNVRDAVKIHGKEAYYWKLTLSCNHIVFREISGGPNNFYRNKPHKFTRCEHCHPTEAEKGLKIMQESPVRIKINRKPRSRSPGKPKTPVASSRCACGRRRMKISIPVPHDPISMGYKMFRYCWVCDTTGSPVTEQELDKMREIYQNVYSRRPHVQTIPERIANQQVA